MAKPPSLSVMRSASITNQFLVWKISVRLALMRFRHAVLAVASGVYDTALVLGVEKYKDRPGRGLAREGVHPYHNDGSTAPGLFALAATRYMHTFGMTRETLAKVSVKNHYNGSLNPKPTCRRRSRSKKC